MPLLKGRFVVPLEPKLSIEQKDTVYTIEHTEEKFTSKDAYQKKLCVYDAPLWTCQCTGHINLKHKEAIESEKETREQIKEKFPEVFEKTVLEIVHHCTDSLDSLVDRASLKLYEYMVPGEPASLKLKAGNKIITGHVIKADPQPKDGSPQNAGSPSSDKENQDKPNPPKKGDGANSEPPKSPYKGLPKLAPCKYSFKLTNEDKIVNGIPFSDLLRSTKIPNKDLIKIFIRCYSARGGYFTSSPWIVDKEMCEKHGIKDKVEESSVSIEKRIELSRKAFEETAREYKKKSRRSSALTPLTSPVRYGAGKKNLLEKKVDSKQPKLSFGTTKSSEKSSPKKSQSTSNSHNKKTPTTPSKNTPSKTLSTPGKKTPKKEILVGSSSESDEEISLLDLKKRSPKKTPSKTPTKRKASKETESSDSDSEEEISLAELKKRSPKKSLSKKPSSMAGSQAGESGDDFVKKKSKSEKKAGKSGKDDKGKKLKQATLFEMKGSKDSSSTKKSTTSSPTKPRQKTQPLVVEKLLKEMKKKDGGNKIVVSMLVSKCVRELNEKQRKNVPEPASELVHKKWLKVQEKKKLEKMTEEERKEYHRVRQRQRTKEFLKKKRTKFEDTELKLKSLPAPKLVPTPDGVPNELFGDITMFTEFVNSYKGLLMPDNDEPIYTDQLLKSVSSGKEGFYYMAKVLKILLQTLLQDDLTSDYKELTVPLSDIPVNEFTASELVRLCLRKHDEDMGQDDNASEDSEQNEVEEVSEELLEQLESCELYELEPQSQLELLSGLTHRLMSSYSVQDYMQEKLTEASDLWRKRNQMLKQKNDLIRREKEFRKTKGAAQKEEVGDETKTEGMTLKNFYGAKDSGIEDSDEDMATVIKRRRMNAAKDKEERLKREREEKIKKDKEYELYKKLEETEKFEKTFNSGVTLSKMVQRVTPIGSDRNHNRYWVFSQGTPGIYVEKGWANKDIEYCTRPKDAVSDEDESSSSEEEETTEQNDKKTRAKRSRCRDKTFPHQGQNLWFVYDDAEELDKLEESLHPQGAREGPLQQEVKKCRDHVIDMLKKSNKTTEQQTSDTDQDMDLITGFREELLDMENRLKAGSLGGVEDYNDWEKDLNNAHTTEQFGKCLKRTEVHILDKFRMGELKKTMPRSEIVKVNSIHSFMKTMEVFQRKERTFDDEGNFIFEEMYPVCQLMWRDAVDNCTTWSRLHVLLGILNSCIKWEMSAENAKCKICLKKGDDSALLLCDDCNKAYHMYCLRPRLDEVPKGDWFCAACTPTDQRRRSRVTKRIEPASNQVSDEESEEEIQHDTQCIVCSGEDKLIFCATCPSAFHLDCHEPPLRREPRQTWRCMQCTSGIRIRKSRRAAAKKRKRYNDDFVEDWEDEEKPRKKRKTEEEIVKVDTSKSRSERYKNRYGFELPESEDSGSDSETEEEEEEEEESEEEVDAGSTKTTRNKRVAIKEVANVCDTPPKKSSPEEQSPTPTKRKPRSKPRVNGEVNSHEMEMRSAEEILGKLRRHRNSWPFQDPVDREVVPDYYDVIKHPMDFLTMKKKCESQQYKKVSEFVDDLALVFSNCEHYNKPDSEVYKCIAPLEKIARDNIKRLLPGICYPRNGNPVVDHDYL